MGLIEQVAGDLGRAVGSFKRGVLEARRRRPAFIGSWAESQHWSGGDYMRRGAQRRAIQNSWVYTAVEMIAREVSAAEFMVQRMDMGDEPVTVPNHPLVRVLRRPNPWIGRAFLWQYTALWLELDGNAYWFVSCDDYGNVAEIWPLPSNDIEVMPGNEERFIDYYQYTANGTQYKIAAEYVAHIRLPNPFDIFRGLSPLAAAMLPADSDSAMARWNGSFFGRDNVMPSAIINLSSGDPDRPIDPNDADRLKQDLRSSYQAINRKTAITTANTVQAVMLGWNAKDMDFIGGRQFMKEEIFAIYGVPAGLLDKNATEANASTADRVFKEKTVWPLLVNIAEQLTADLVEPFYGRGQEAVFADIRPSNRILELQEVGAAGPYLTVDEVRERYWSLPPLPEGAGTGVPGAMAEPEPALGAPKLEMLGAGQVGKAALWADELRRWRDKAVKSVKGGGPAAVRFESEFIPDEVGAALRERLAGASTVEEVRAAFAEEDSGREFFRQAQGWTGYG